MGLRFTKMHGIGNDYVYVNGFAERVPDPPALARRLSDRHFGVGADGLILIQPPGVEARALPATRPPVCRMEMYNADGSRGRMCGNGLRCVAKYAYERLLAEPEDVLSIETDDGLKEVRVHPGPEGKVERVTVDMGPPRLERALVPLADGGDPRSPAVDLPIRIGGRTFRITALSMGNPHAVTRVDTATDGSPLPPLDALPLADWGPLFERHPWFPERINTEFVAPLSRSELNLRVWERGSGETLACGTGACAAVVAGVLGDWCDRRVLVHLRGGDLEIHWREEPPGAVLMTGPAVEVFDGELCTS